MIVLLATGCGSGTGGGSGGSSDSATFRLGTFTDVDSLNPFVALNSTAYTTFEYIYPVLVQYDPSLNIIPDFARSWTESGDGLTWTFHTQPGAKWSDGKPLTASDAAWTISTILKYQNGATANSAGYVAHLTSATAPDATTLVLRYSRPVANVLPQLQQVPILPEHIWAKYATGDGSALKRFTNPAPIVSGGSFILEKFVPKQIALFKRNPSFYGLKPHLAELGLQIFSNQDAMVTALKSGQLDGVDTVPPTSVATLKAASLVVPTAPQAYFDDFIINDNPKQAAAHAELMNPLLREALDHAVDRSAIVSTSLLGFGRPGSSIIPPATGWSDPLIKSATFDLALAGQLLDKAGYKMGPNGLRVANGHPMAYTVILPPTITNGYGFRSFQIIQTDFAKIGVKLSPQNLDDSAAYNAITASNYTTFEMAMWDWAPLTDPDFMLSAMTCNSWNSWNDSGYCSAAYDKLYAEQSVAISAEQRHQIVNQMQQMVAAARPYLVLDYPLAIEAHGAAWTDLPMVAGASFTAMSRIPFDSVRPAH